MGAKQGKKQRKHGRNKVMCAAYASGGTQNINKCKRLARHLFRRPNDSCAKKALDRLIPYWVPARNRLKNIGAKYAVVLTENWWGATEQGAA